MKLSSFQEIAEAENGQQIPSFQGTIKKVFDQKTDIGQYGQWWLQNIILQDEHANEIIVIRENGLEIRRLALTRTMYFNGANNYFAAPRAAISNDGSLVIMDSNFGQFGKPRVALIETGYGKPVASK